MVTSSPTAAPTTIGTSLPDAEYAGFAVVCSLLFCVAASAPFLKRRTHVKTRKEEIRSAAPFLAIPLAIFALSTWIVACLVAAGSANDANFSGNNMTSPMFVADFKLLNFAYNESSTWLALSTISVVYTILAFVLARVAVPRDTTGQRNVERDASDFLAYASCAAYACVTAEWAWGSSSSGWSQYQAQLPLDVVASPWIPMAMAASVAVAGVSVVSAGLVAAYGAETQSDSSTFRWSGAKGEDSAYFLPTTSMNGWLCATHALAYLFLSFGLAFNFGTFAICAVVGLALPLVFALSLDPRSFWLFHNIGVATLCTSIFFPLMGSASWPVATATWVYALSYRSTLVRQLSYASASNQSLTLSLLSGTAVAFAIVLTLGPWVAALGRWAERGPEKPHKAITTSVGARRSSDESDSGASSASDAS